MEEKLQRDLRSMPHWHVATAFFALLVFLVSLADLIRGIKPIGQGSVFHPYLNIFVVVVSLFFIILPFVQFKRKSAKSQVKQN